MTLSSRVASCRNGRSASADARFFCAPIPGLIRWATLCVLLLTGNVSSHQVLAREGAGPYVFSLEDVRYLSAEGSPELALSLLDRLQANTVEEDWLALEKERIHLLRALRQWRQADARLKALAEINPGQRLWASEQRAGLALQADKAEQALKVLRELIWSPGDGIVSKHQLAQWRRMLIEACLKLNLDLDANRAMQRYLQDYANDAEIGAVTQDIRLLQARVLLRNGEPEAVPPLLKGVTGREAALLQLMARLRLAPGEESTEPRFVMAQATALASRNDIPRSLKFEAWALVSEAARIAGHKPGRILALERLLGAERLPSDLKENFGIQVDSLWQAYLDYGRETVRQASLNILDTRGMMDWVQSALTREPIKVRGVLALILDGEKEPGLWQESAAEMMNLLAAGHGGDRLVVRVMGRAKWKRALDVLPDTTIVQLVQRAVGVGAHREARRLMRLLNHFDRHDNDLDWHQRMARLSLLVGDEPMAVRHINRLMDPETGVLAQEGRGADELMQLLLDVQAQGRHDTALTLFSRLSRLPLSKALLKEVFFWMGDSYRAQQRHDEAAMSYLHSAELARRQGDVGQWAETARFEAARALERGGFLSDARVQYRRLLQSAKDEKREAMIRARLERLAVMAAGKGQSTQSEAFRPTNTAQSRTEPGKPVQPKTESSGYIKMEKVERVDQ